MNPADVENRYQEALDYLYGYIDYSRVKQAELAKREYSLDPFVHLLGQMGNPQDLFPSVHVAGTKGKGSTSAIIASVLQEAGYKVGFFTSPHLQDYCERIQINGIPISHADFANLLESIKPEIESVRGLNTFEISTLLAFEYFSKEQVDIAVLEVGLGGRLDATNVVTPLVSVITSISFDHTKILGNTIEGIAGEKGGIIKPGRPVVVAPQPFDVLPILHHIADEQRAKLIDVTKTYTNKILSSDLSAQKFEVIDGKTSNIILEIPLLGRHQIENATTAYAALQWVKAAGFTISDDTLRQGMKNVFWPGRFEVLRAEPPFILDSAHNRDSSVRLLETINDYLDGRELLLLFGASADKDIMSMYEVLLPRAQYFVASRSMHPRAALPEHLLQLADAFGMKGEAYPTIEEALDAVLAKTKDGTAVIATGSVFLVAAVRNVWDSRIHHLQDFGEIGKTNSE